MATQAYAHVRTFTQAHSIVFLSDNLRNTLREVIRENGISPSKMMRDWETIEDVDPRVVEQALNCLSIRPGQTIRGFLLDPELSS